MYPEQFDEQYPTPVDDSPRFQSGTAALLLATVFFVMAMVGIAAVSSASDPSGSFNGTSLTVDDTEISVFDGGVATMTVQMGQNGDGLLYLVLGSVAGTRPGIDLSPSINLPLNDDGVGGYLAQTLAHPNTAPLTASLGVTLGELGTATCRFTVPPESDPGFAGLTVSHSAMIWWLGSNPPVLIGTTNAVDVDLVP